MQLLSTLPLFLNLELINFSSIQYYIGISCSLSWFTILKYIEYEDNIFLFTIIFRKTLPKIILFLFENIPILMGFMVVGMALFGDYLKFSSIRETLTTLTCIMYGNSIYEIYTDLDNEGFIAYIYSTFFTIYFYIILQNIIVTIFCSLVYNKSELMRNKELAE